MRVKIIYPDQTPKALHTLIIRDAVRWFSLVSAYACILINLFFGGKAWSPVVVWSLWFIWSFIFARNLVEYNRISQTAKLMLYTCILLALIDLCLFPGWAMFVIPVVCFAGMAVIAVSFFTDISKQKYNMMPMLWVICAAIVSITASYIGWPDRSWPMIVFGTMAFAILLICIAVLGKDLLREIKKRFHTK